MIAAREVLLLVAGLGSIGLGLFHFVLPRVYGWGPYLDQLPSSISWGTLSINAFLSTLFVLMGGVTIAGMFDRSSGGLTISFLAAMAMFWAVNCVYQIAIPFPLPASMAGIRWGLIVLAALMTLLYVGVLVATNRV